MVMIRAVMMLQIMGEAIEDLLVKMVDHLMEEVVMVVIIDHLMEEVLVEVANLIRMTQTLQMVQMLLVEVGQEEEE